MRHLPASPETVADYLTERAEHCNLTTLQKTRIAISKTLVAAGFEDRYAKGVVKSTLGQLAAVKGGERCRSKRVSGGSLDAADIELIRAAAFAPRPRGKGVENPASATRRGQVELALCSLALEAGLQCEQVAALEWQDLGVDGNQEPTITVRTWAGAGKVIRISERAYGDLEAIAPEDGEASSRIFSLDAEQVAVRVRAAARAAGLESRIAVPRSHQDTQGATATPPSAKDRAYASYWRAFCAWCEERGEEGLPARPERVAEYLREVSETRGIYTIQGIRYAIRDAHRRAGHGDRCVSGHADAVIVDLRRRGLRFSPTSLDSESLEAIRAAATMLRLERPDWKTQRHTLVDVALCSVLHVSGLTVRQVVALKWRDVEMLGADSVRLTLRSTTDPHDIAATREIAGEVVRDLEAIRGNARPEDSVFGISYGGVYYRVRQIAEIAGLGVSSEAGPSHTPREGPPRTAQ